MRTDNHPPANEAMYLTNEVIDVQDEDWCCWGCGVQSEECDWDCGCVHDDSQCCVHEDDTGWDCGVHVGDEWGVHVDDECDVHDEDECGVHDEDECGVRDEDCGTNDDDCGVLDEVVAVSGCAENKGVGDADLDDVKESWLASFGSPVDCDPLFRGEELLESSSSISEDINMSATCERSFF